MLTTTENTVNFNEQFSIELTVFSVDPQTGLEIPITEIPQVAASFYDPDVHIDTSVSKVVISGKYTGIFKTYWTWLDLNKNTQVTLTPPNIGEFYKIIQVESPSSVSEQCLYTVTSSMTSDVFTHTVLLPDYSSIGNMLKTLLLESL